MAPELCKVHSNNINERVYCLTEHGHDPQLRIRSFLYPDAHGVMGSDSDKALKKSVTEAAIDLQIRPAEVRRRLEAGETVSW